MSSLTFESQEVKAYDYKKWWCKPHEYKFIFDIYFIAQIKSFQLCEKLHETFVFKCYLLCDELPCNCSASDTLKTFLQNQYFVKTIARDESASDAFLERERDGCGGKKSSQTGHRERPAWLACPARGAELANTSFPGLTAQILFRPRYTALLTIHFQGCQKNYVVCCVRQQHHLEHRVLRVVEKWRFSL